MADNKFVLMLKVAIFLYFFHTLDASDEAGELILTQILFRHGDRSAVRSYPKNDYGESSWPQGFGQLSQKGMVQHYNLGKYFRNRYVEEHKLLSSKYKRVEILVESTDFDRTLMSAYSNLAGLYPPGNSSQEWNPDIPWQPIPVHTRPVEQDHKLSTDAPCPRYTQLYELELKSDNIKKEEEENKDFYKFIMEHTGVANESIRNIWGIFDTLYCEQQHREDLKFKLPDWANNTLKNNITVFEKLRSLDSLQFDVEFDGPLRSRLRGGPLLKEMIENMKSKINGSMNDRKAFMYSAHDSTVAAFTSAMRVYNKLLPPYATAVMVELYKNNDKYSVQVLYKNETNNDPFVLTLPNCTSICPFDAFVESTKAAIPGDIIQECRLNPEKIDNRMTIIIAVSCTIGALLLVVIITVVACKYRKQTQFSYYGIQTTA